MKPERSSKRLLSITRSKAKMYEYNVPENFHIEIPRDPARLFSLTIGMLGDLAARINLGNQSEEEIRALKESLSFSAYFFDAYLHSRLNTELNPYLLLLGSASYYLCELPGSALILAGEIGRDCPDMEGQGLEIFLHWLLLGSFAVELPVSSGPFRERIITISDQFRTFFSTGSGENDVLSSALELREFVYDMGTARQLLLIDVVCAVIRKRIENSTWINLPRYTGLSMDRWRRTIKRVQFIKEFWPSQHLLGQHDVYRGNSAIVQMPTSAGKTKASEIIIRSAFLSRRTSLVVIVAPFRTLCHEIKNDLVRAFKNENIFIDGLSDVYQIDFSFRNFLNRQQILIVTPEKLNYILRHVPELAAQIGLLIFDEGHQFDSGIRGITYELLVTTLKDLIPQGAQKVLISAVIQNADQVGEWLNGKGSEIISGIELSPTIRSIGFSSWRDRLGRLQFVNPQNIDEEEYFVPRIIEQYPLQPIKPSEKKQRLFPEKVVGRAKANDIALFLGLKVVTNGSVAVFCGTKVSVLSICRRAYEIFERSVQLASPATHSNQVEVDKLSFLIDENFGKDSITSHCAKLGFFAHHGDVPHGIRLSIEYALKVNLIKFVICTSTLAQGVNLPIRYLIVTSTFQGREQIRVRDFQNLIGRSGRSGIHTEGSILFSDPKIFETKDGVNSSWDDVKNLLRPENSEPCSSTLFSIFDSLKSNNQRRAIRMKPLDLVHKYIEGPDALRDYIHGFAIRLHDKGYSEEELSYQVHKKLKIISAIESFLLSHLSDIEDEEYEEAVLKLARGTFAYYLGNANQKKQIEELFSLLSENIHHLIPESDKRLIFGKTLFGVRDSLKVFSWLEENLDNLQNCENDLDRLNVLWPLMSDMVGCRPFVKCSQPEVLLQVAIDWVEGSSYKDLYDLLVGSGARIVWGEGFHSYTLDNLVEICEVAISYESTLVLGAIIDLLEIDRRDETILLSSFLQALLKRLKYGLSSTHAIILYECGFADRVVSMDLASVFEDLEPVKETMVNTMKARREQVSQVINKYPSYFSQVYRNLI